MTGHQHFAEAGDENTLCGHASVHTVRAMGGAVTSDPDRCTCRDCVRLLVAEGSLPGSRDDCLVDPATGVMA